MEDSYHSFLLILGFTHCVLQPARADLGEWITFYIQSYIHSYVISLIHKYHGDGLLICCRVHHVKTALRMWLYL